MSTAVTSLASHTLSCHPRTPCEVVHEVAVDVGLETPDVLVVAYRIVGEVAKLRVPGPDTPLDPDRLWAHTCCELFVAPADRPEYVEWNFSPSGQLARFGFSAYRCRAPSSMRPAARVRVTVDRAALWLEARVPLEPGIGDRSRLSLTTVIEDATGGLSYWALRHPLHRPDFHHRDGFALALTLGSRPAVARDDLESP